MGCLVWRKGDTWRAKGRKALKEDILKISEKAKSENLRR